MSSYECRHGAGYTVIASTYTGITANLVHFVPPAAKDETCPCELWILNIENTGKKTRKLRTFSYVELSFRDTLGDQLNLDWCQHILEAGYQDGIITSKTRFAPTTNFFGSSVRPTGFDTDREQFVGNWRDLSNPEREVVVL